jgi:hypothetical protein
MPDLLIQKLWRWAQKAGFNKLSGDSDTQGCDPLLWFIKLMILMLLL